MRWEGHDYCSGISDNLLAGIVLFTKKCRILFPKALVLGPFSGLLQRKWILVLLAILIVALVVESVILVIIFSNWSLGGQNFPKFQFNPPVITNCSSLSSHLVSQNNQNRTVLFDCSTSTKNMSAFTIYAPFTLNYVHESGKPDLAEPIFTLPGGYLNLSITDSNNNFICPPPSLLPTLQTSTLISEQTYVIGTYAAEYDYCAIISNSASNIQGFKIQWIEGTAANLAPHPNFSLSASTSNITISAGQTATASVDVTSRFGYNGELNLWTALSPANVTSPIVTSLNLTHAVLAPYATVHVSMTIQSSTNTTRGTYLVYVWVQSPVFINDIVVTVGVT